MFTLPVGLIAFLVVLVGSAGDVKASDYIVAHSIIIVFGGTVAVGLICTPWSVWLSLMHNVIGLFKGRPTISQLKPQLLQLSQNRGSVAKSTDPLVNYAIGLWEKGIDQNMFVALISQHRDKLEHEDTEAHNALVNLAKYPPALGMMGTVMGMITLFANLGTSDKSMLGPSLAVAMTATFYGLVITQGFLSPLADRVNLQIIYKRHYYGYVYEILNLINNKEPSSMVEEEIVNREAA